MFTKIGKQEWQIKTNFGTKLFSHEQESYPTTSFTEKSIECDFQTDRYVYVDLQ